MPIFDAPPPIPQRGARSTFSSAVDAFIRWLAALPAKLDLFLAELTTLASGGAYSFPFVFDGAVTDARPGAGKFRFNTPSQNTAFILRLDTLTSAGSNIANLLSHVLSGSSSVKASIRLVKRNDPTKWLVFDVSSGTSHTGYLNLSVVARAWSSETPFATGDDIAVYIDKVGDKGDVGNADKKVQVAPAPVNGVVTVDYRNGNCLVWTPVAGATTTLNITNWPASGTLGEFWIEGTNMGAASTVAKLGVAINWLRPDGTFANSDSITTNHGAVLRPAGEDTVLLWGRTGAPQKGKVAR